jgi:hypothetical protein
MSKILLTYDGVLISPAPLLGVNKEFIYANDAIIGYTYVVTLTGYASSVVSNNNTSNLLQTVLSLKDIQSAFHKNGKRLLVVCGSEEDQTILIDGHGGQVRSFNVEESDNKWITYAKYTVTLEFSDVYFYGNDNLVEPETEVGPNTLGNNPFYLDLIKLRSYNDNWNFNISEEDMYSYYSRTINNAVNIEDYTRINVEYTISANGKHFFDANGVVKPAWQVAKDFVQKKLYHQIKTFRDTNRGPLGFATFNNTSYDSTDIQDNLSTTLDKSLSSTYDIASAPSVLPILGASIANSYKIYNETILCTTSESDGIFTATYKCILKRFVTNSIFPQNSIHTFSVSYDQTLDFNDNNRTISVNGTLQGLIPTNILAPTVFNNAVVNSNGENFSLPNQGYFLETFHTPAISKYTYALQDFVTYVAQTLSPTNHNGFSADDLSDGFKNVLGVNYASLFPNTIASGTLICEEGNITLSSILGLPQSFNVDHNYGEGSISYAAEYSTERSCAMERGFENFSVTENDGVPNYVEFLIPGRTNGPILQNLNSYKNKRITFEFDGKTKKGCVGGTPFAIGYSGVVDPNDTDNYIEIPQKVLCMIHDTEEAHPELIPESYSVGYNPIDGSYKLSKTYMVAPVNNTTECQQ